MGTDGQQGPKWTVMLYMAASKDPRTEQAAIHDIRELERVGTTDNVNVIVQIDREWPGYAERYCVRKGFSEFCESLSEQTNLDIDSGTSMVLREFVTWGRAKFPAKHYLLVLWGHSYGLGFGRDHGDALTLRELATALAPQAGGAKVVDILGVNACAMSYAEAAYELRDTADFFVGPEIAMPFAGWPYESILNAINNDPAIKPKDLGERVIQEFIASFEEALEPQSVALTLLDLPKAVEIAKPLETLTTALTAAIAPPNGIRDDIADAFLQTAHGDVRPLIDLADLCDKLSALGCAPEVAAAATKLRAVFEPAKGFVLKHQAGPELEGLHGMGIFAPSVTGAADLMRLDLSIKEYEKLGLAKDTKWADFAYKNLKDLLDPMNKAVAEFVHGTGATSFEDRTAVAQLMLGIHQSFHKLDKTASDVKAKVRAVLNGNGAANTHSSKSPIEAGVAARFGPPFLRLAANLRQSSDSPERGATTTWSDPAPFTSVADSLANLEGALGNLERTAKKVMTHASLGLGADDPGGKPGLGADDPGGKPGLGADDPGGKPGLGADDPGGKPGLGIFPSMARGDRGYLSLLANGGSSVAQLYGQVAWSLQLIEDAVARLENSLQAIVIGPASAFPGDEKYQKHVSAQVSEQVESSFRELTEVTTNAKRTAFRVLAHPAHGLGPTPGGGLGRGSRQQLATVGGLSPRVLRLL
jgi:Clostripain family